MQYDSPVAINEFREHGRRGSRVPHADDAAQPCHSPHPAAAHITAANLSSAPARVLHLRSSSRRRFPRGVGDPVDAVIGTRIRPTGGFSCYIGFRSLPLAAFLAWRFSFRVLHAAFSLLLPPLCFFAIGASLRTAHDDGLPDSVPQARPDLTPIIHGFLVVEGLGSAKTPS